eukprot:COSAG02_NODE_611_length_19555_cov_34.449270_6_plen_97_part_00
MRSDRSSLTNPRQHVRSDRLCDALASADPVWSIQQPHSRCVRMHARRRRPAAGTHGIVSADRAAAAQRSGGHHRPVCCTTMLERTASLANSTQELI